MQYVNLSHSEVVTNSLFGERHNEFLDVI
jgi:hypothetical protein